MHSLIGPISERVKELTQIQKFQYEVSKVLFSIFKKADWEQRRGAAREENTDSIPQDSGRTLKS